MLHRILLQNAAVALLVFLAQFLQLSFALHPNNIAVSTTVYLPTFPQPAHTGTFLKLFKNDDNSEFINQASVWSIVSGFEHQDHHSASQEHAATKRGDSTSSSSSSIRWVPLLPVGDKIGKDESVHHHHRRVADVTWNWCAHFVARYNLCPWAAASVVDPAAIHIYIVNDDDTAVGSHLETIVESIAEEFARKLNSRKEERIDPNTSICFVVLCPAKRHAMLETNAAASAFADFSTFYEWFLDIEERWDMVDTVTLAPFHPGWKYEGDDADVLELEKRSPFPTISMVATSTIDKAGPAATTKIANHNEAILQEKSVKEWNVIYNAAVLENGGTPTAT